MVASVQIDAVDSTASPDNGFLVDHRRAHPGAVRCRDVLGMVLGVLRRAGDHPIRRLRIFGHGRSGQQNSGGGTRPNASQAMFVTQLTTGAPGRLINGGILELLRGHFTADAVVELHGCSVGRGWEGEALVYQLSQLLQVRVRAALQRQVSDRGDRFEGPRFLEGDGRPGSLTPLTTRHH
jgi:hypothetical protein